MQVTRASLTLPLLFSGVVHASALAGMMYVYNNPEPIKRSVPLEFKLVSVKQHAEKSSTKKAEPKPKKIQKKIIAKKKAVRKIKKKIQPKKEIIPESTSLTPQELKTIGANYEQLIISVLERHKQYPRRARQRYQQGETVLFLKLSREGRVLESAIRRSSGFRLLDKEVKEMLKRAAVFPAAPDNYPGKSFDFVIPVKFQLN